MIFHPQIVDDSMNDRLFLCEPAEQRVEAQNPRFATKSIVEHPPGRDRLKQAALVYGNGLLFFIARLAKQMARVV